MGFLNVIRIRLSTGCSQPRLSEKNRDQRVSTYAKLVHLVDLYVFTLEVSRPKEQQQQQQQGEEEREHQRRVKGRSTTNTVSFNLQFHTVKLLKNYNE